MLQFLDIIIDHPRRTTDTLRRVKETLPDTVQTPVKPETTDSLTQLADIAPRPPHMLGFDDDMSAIIWTVFMVLVALSLCYYFVCKYRNSHKI